MVQKWLALIVFALLAGCALIDDEEPIQFLDYECDDIVVVGRVETLGSTPVYDPDSVLGYGVWDMEVRVKRVIRGTERRKTIPVSGLAHAQMRDDVDFLIVLGKSSHEGGYFMRWANLERFTRPAGVCTHPA